MAAGRGAAALDHIADGRGARADNWRYSLGIKRAAMLRGAEGGEAEQKRQIGLAAIARQRARLEELRESQEVAADSFLLLQEELDFNEMSLRTEDERRIEES